jgi:transposase
MAPKPRGVYRMGDNRNPKEALGTEAERRGVGRPTLYRPEYPKQAAKLCLLGATDKELSEFFEVSESTINLWKQEYPEFSESIKRGKVLADAQVAEKLFYRATGYTCHDSHISNYLGKITVTPIKKHYPPDTTAAIFWLKNRQKDKWRDKQEHEISGHLTLEDLLEQADSLSVKTRGDREKE